MQFHCFVYVSFLTLIENHLKKSLFKSKSFEILSQAPKFTLEMIMEQVTALQELLPIRMRWEPVEKILALNGIPLMLRVIAYSYEWSYSGRYLISHTLVIICIKIVFSYVKNGLLIETVVFLPELKPSGQHWMCWPFAVLYQALRLCFVIEWSYLMNHRPLALILYWGHPKVKLSLMPKYKSRLWPC